MASPAIACRVYIGMRYPKIGCHVGAVDDNGLVLNLNPRHDLFNHSPEGFEWGYAGSGPAQLALALVADATGDDELARLVYQDFKKEIVVGLPHMRWMMTAREIAKFANLLLSAAPR